MKSLSSSVPWPHPTLHPAKATLCDEAFRTPPTSQPPKHFPLVEQGLGQFLDESFTLSPSPMSIP